ncbi:MAG TPA: hypothetical protein VLF21_03270 [Candidatus Saccharimonadales bacterium]|nr:hypothetical protein [Candidatus Saccharimonadales bacterium]
MPPKGKCESCPWGTKGPPRAVEKYKGIRLCRNCFDAACLGYSIWNKGGRENHLKAVAEIDLGHDVLTAIAQDICGSYPVNPVRLPKGRQGMEDWARMWTILLADQLTALEPRDIAGFMGFSAGQIRYALWNASQPKPYNLGKLLDEAIERIQKKVPYQLVWA